MVWLVLLSGLIVGSFLNVIIHRSASGGSIFGISSQCPDCQHNLAWQDMIPILSFFLLGRKCRFCHRKISWQYPIVELITGGIFALIYAINIAFGFGTIDSTTYEIQLINLLFQFVFACFLIVIFVFDFKHYLILDKFVFPATLLALAYQAINQRVADGLLGAALLSGFFGLLYFISRGKWIGFGDVKLGLFLGLLIPFPETLSVFFIAYLSGAVIALMLLISNQKKFQDKLPFGTFLTFAAIIGMLLGRELTDWYLGLIGVI